MLLPLSEARGPQHRPLRTHRAHLGLGVLPGAVPRESHTVGIRKPAVWLSSLPSPSPPSPGPSFAPLSWVPTPGNQEIGWGLERTLPRSPAGGPGGGQSTDRKAHSCAGAPAVGCR